MSRSALPFSSLAVVVAAIALAVPCASVPAGAQASGLVADLPLDPPSAGLPPLRSRVDARLERELDTRLRARPLWKRLIERERMAVGLVDLAEPDAVRFARVNGSTMLYAASLPKLAILLAVGQAFEDGELEESAGNLELAREMIARSDNAAAATLYETLGFDYVESVLTAPRYGLYDVDNDGGLWVGKAYGVDDDRHRDPVAGLVHGATATQVCRFYYLLAFGQLVNRDRSAQMLEMLVDPELHHKFVRTLDVIVPDAEVFRKSGTWRDWHSDSALVWGPVWRRYIVVALVQHPSGETILRELIPVAEEALRSR